MVKIHKSNESTELALGLWFWKFTDGFNFLRNGRDTVAVNVVSEEIKRGYAKEAFVGVDDNTVRSESTKHSSQVIKVLFWGGAGNEYVINVDISRWDATEYLIHEALKCLCCISESKWHLDKLKESKWCGDSCFWDVVRGHWYLVIGTDQI